MAMPPKSKGLTYATRLRTTEEERVAVERVQAWAAVAGLAVSLNDVVRHLIRRAEITVPRTEGDGLAAIMAHGESCPDCQPYQPPRCLDGLYLRELNRRRCGSGIPAEL